ncbi:cysteine desulfurase [Candidatus Microgenomates bacterium]|nr:cysteine desulfurase [Candidatus Microgenomates bacterium]
MDVNKIRQDFPILSRKINGKNLIYFDNAATSQKPESVLKTIDDYYRNHNANIHRAIHTLGEEATAMYENARNKVANFIKAARPEEIIFTSGTTASLNLVAYAWGRLNLSQNEEIILTVMEHHSNLVPWQQLAFENGLTLKYLEIDESGTIKADALEEIITPKTKLLAITHMSNVLGTINPIKEMIKVAHRHNVTTVIDAAQSVPHLPVNVQSLDCDFLAFSGHKMLGPTGVGVLYGKQKQLEKMPPFFFGGHMIKEVYLEKTLFNEIPAKFEAGTSPIAQVVGLGAAIDYLEKIGMDNVREHEKALTDYALSQLAQIEGLTIYGPKNSQIRGGVIAFNLHGIHSHDVAQILDAEGIAIRVGNHCAMPLHTALQIPASCRASFYLYNTKEEIDLLKKGLLKTKKVFL